MEFLILHAFTVVIQVPVSVGWSENTNVRSPVFIPVSNHRDITCCPEMEFLILHAVTVVIQVPVSVGWSENTNIRRSVLCPVAHHRNISCCPEAEGVIISGKDPISIIVKVPDTTLINTNL